MLMLLLQVGTYIAALQFSKSIRQISQLLMRFCYLISNDIVKFEETTILEVYFRAFFLALRSVLQSVLCRAFYNQTL